MPDFVKKYRKEICLVIFALGMRILFLLLLVHAAGTSGFLKGDALSFMNLAINTEDSHVFSYLAPPSFIPTLTDVPLYPLFLVITRARRWIYSPLIVQGILGALTTLLIFKIGERLGWKSGGFIAAVIYALEPGTLFYTNQIFSETLFTFFLVLAVYFLLSEHLVLSAALLGLASLTRPIALFVSPLFILFVFFWIQKSRLETSKRGLLFALTFLVVISPWMARNYIQFGTLSLTTHAPHLLVTYTIPTYWAWKEHVPFPEAQRQSREYFARLGYTQDIILGGRRDAEEKINTIAKSIALRDPVGYTISQTTFFPQFFLSSSWDFIYNTLRGTSSKEALYGEHPTSTPLRVAGSIFWLTALLVVTVGILVELFCADGNRLVVVFFLLNIFAFAFLTGALAQTRYRFPVNPLLLLLAGAAIDWGLERYKRAR